MPAAVAGIVIVHVNEPSIATTTGPSLHARSPMLNAACTESAAVNALPVSTVVLPTIPLVGVIVTAAAIGSGGLPCEETEVEPRGVTVDKPCAGDGATVGSTPAETTALAPVGADAATAEDCMDTAPPRTVEIAEDVWMLTPAAEPAELETLNEGCEGLAAAGAAALLLGGAVATAAGINAAAGTTINRPMITTAASIHIRFIDSFSG